MKATTPLGQASTRHWFSRKLFLLSARLLILVALAAGAEHGFARPRQPCPPFPEFAAPVLFHDTFDWGYSYGTTNVEVVLANYGTLRESWSGYALQRTGIVPPYNVPALGAGGRTNVACLNGAVRFWIIPDWSSSTVPGGTGPGAEVVLAQLAAAGGGQAAVAWSLRGCADGTALYLEAETDAGPTVVFTAAIGWQAGQTHLVCLNYGPVGSDLFLDGQRVAQGVGTLPVPSSVGVLTLGSSLAGTETPSAAFDEFFAFARPQTEGQAAWYYAGLSAQAALGPIAPAEDQARLDLLAHRLALRQTAALTVNAAASESLMEMDSPGCPTGDGVSIVNLASIYSTNDGWTVTFDVVGGTNGLIYDVFATTNFVGNSITNSQWVWLTNTYTCSTVSLTNQPGAYRFYILGTPQDSDGDGLTDAYERLINHGSSGKTDPANPDSDGDGLADGDDPDPFSPAAVPSLQTCPVNKCPIQ